MLYESIILLTIFANVIVAWLSNGKTSKNVDKKGHNGHTSQSLVCFYKHLWMTKPVSNTSN